MTLLDSTLILLFAASLAVAFAPKLHLPLELFLLLASLLVSILPGTPNFTLEPEAVFYLFLPPILFAAAYFTSWHDFRRNLRPITLLSIGLVIFTVLGVGYGIHFFFPVIPLPIGFLLGAIVSPPDASAATSIAKKVGLPRNILTIIEGESLVNDATALVCYRFAIAAVLSGTFSTTLALEKFFVVAIGGGVVGFAISAAMVLIIRKIKNSTAETLLSFVACFSTYTVAEQLHFSGVISTVVGGLIFGLNIPRFATAETRMEARAAWNVALLAVNGLVFALIGLQLPHAMSGLVRYSADTLVAMLATLLAFLIALRFIWIFVTAYLSRLFFPKLREKDSPQFWKALVILSWTGMRGIVSLAAALAIPISLTNGEAFPQRDLIIFLVYGVMLFTLIVPTLTLSPLVRFLRIQKDHVHHAEEARARLAMTEAARDLIQSEIAEQTQPEPSMKEIHARYERLYSRLAPNLSEAGFSTLDLSEQQQRRLLMELLDEEREALLKLRTKGQLHDEIFHLLSGELDVEELRLKQNARPW